MHPFNVGTIGKSPIARVGEGIAFPYPGAIYRFFSGARTMEYNGKRLGR